MVQPGLLRPTILRTQQFAALRVPYRYKSITAAIERGKQSDQGYSERRTAGSRDHHHGDTSVQRGQLDALSVLEQDGQQHRKSQHNRTTESRGDTFNGLSRRRDWARPGRDAYRNTSRGKYGRAQREPRQNHTVKSENNSHSDFGTKTIAYNHNDNKDYGSEKPERNLQRAPESLPYTTAASEFLYGYSSVLAAIKANRRKFYKLYIHTRGAKHAGNESILARANMLSIDLKEVGDQYSRVLDKASSGRPHNGFVLEASPLPVPPLVELLSSSIKARTFGVALDRQSREDEMINGTQTIYPYKSAGWRHPLVLYVDGVLDEGNLGAIARSSYFLGVDAIVTPTRQSAPWSQIALKASAGAAEAIPIFKVSQSTDFLGRSAREGWRIYASDAVPPDQQRPRADSSDGQSVTDLTSRVIYSYSRNDKCLPIEHCPVESHPTILMMGAEATGLRSSLLNMAHYKVGIRHGRDVDEVGVDSLNVSVAASLLCFEMLRKPKARNPSNLLF